MDRFSVFGFIALAIMTLGSGSMLPLTYTYGGSQFKSSEVKSIAMFYSIYYFMYNCGSLLSRFISPILRQDIKCFGNDDCLPVAFGVPGVLMLFVVLLFTIVHIFSETSQPSGTTLLNVFACITVKLQIDATYYPH